MLDGLGDGALMPRGQVRVFARKDLSGVGHVAAHQLRIDKRQFCGCGSAGRLFCGAHI